MTRSQRRVPYEDLEQDPPVPLEGDQAHRLARVLRLEPGDDIELFDGRGRTRPARLVSTRAGEVCFEWSGPCRVSETARTLWVGAAVPKGKRVDWMVEKLCELGVSRITPLVAERGVVRPGAEGTKARRWDSIAEEASRQCRRDDVPVVDAPCDLEVWRAGWPPVARVYHAHPEPVALTPRAFLAELGALDSGIAVVLAIGPEGGWSERECGLFRDAGSRALSLGPRILRIETAAAVATALAQAGLGELDRPGR